MPMMVRAVRNGVVVAGSEDTVVVDGNHYFPHAALRQEYFPPSSTKMLCPWKGIASYYCVMVNGAPNADAAQPYRHPLPLPGAGAEDQEPGDARLRHRGTPAGRAGIGRCAGRVDRAAESAGSAEPAGAPADRRRARRGSAGCNWLLHVGGQQFSRPLRRRRLSFSGERRARRRRVTDQFRSASRRPGKGPSSEAEPTLYRPDKLGMLRYLW